MSDLHDSLWLPSGQQQAFRHLMQAFAHPGSIEILTKTPNTHGEAPQDAKVIVLATLLDDQTTLADPDTLLSPQVLKRLEVKPETPDCAAFILARGDHEPGFHPRLGSLESPEGGSTIIVCVEKLGEGISLQLEGPGIESSRMLAVTGLHPHWLTARQRWTQGFPLGVDLILVDDTHIAALPRTTKIHIQGEN